MFKKSEFMPKDTKAKEEVTAAIEVITQLKGLANIIRRRDDPLKARIAAEWEQIFEASIQNDGEMPKAA